MFVIERAAGEAVRIGSHVLRVVAVHSDHIVVALLESDDGDGAGHDPADAILIPCGWSPGATDEEA